MNLLAEFGSEPGEVENVDGKSHFLKYRLCDLDQPPGLRHLAGTGMFAARRTVDQEDPRRLIGRIVTPLRCQDRLARREPIHGNIIGRIGKARPRLARYRRFS